MNFDFELSKRVDCMYTVLTFYSYSIFNSSHIKLLISQSKFSGTRNFSLSYQLFGMNFEFEISRVDVYTVLTGKDF